MSEESRAHLFEYFPGNFVWSQSINAMIDMAGVRVMHAWDVLRDCRLGKTHHHHRRRHGRRGGSGLAERAG